MKVFEIIRRASGYPEDDYTRHDADMDEYDEKYGEQTFETEIELDALGAIDVLITYHRDKDINPHLHVHDPDRLDGERYIKSAKLASEAEEMDDDGKVTKRWPKGTDVKRLPGYSKKTDEELFQALEDHLSR
jgi:hypothetical protein